MHDSPGGTTRRGESVTRTRREIDGAEAGGAGPAAVGFRRVSGFSFLEARIRPAAANMKTRPVLALPLFFAALAVLAAGAGAQGLVLHTFTGNPGEDFGWSVAGVGDLNADGK